MTPNNPIMFICSSGDAILFTEMGDTEYPVRISIESKTGSASLTYSDMDALAKIFNDGGPWYL